MAKMCLLSVGILTSQSSLHTPGGAQAQHILAPTMEMALGGWGTEQQVERMEIPAIHLCKGHAALHAAMLSSPGQQAGQR